MTAYGTAFAAGKAMWFEVKVPNLGSFYFSGEPVELGLPGIEVNQVLQVNTHIIPNSIGGWATSST